MNVNTTDTTCACNSFTFGSGGRRAALCGEVFGFVPPTAREIGKIIGKPIHVAAVVTMEPINILANQRHVGCLGGGQLGRMMAQAASRLGVIMTTLDPGGLDSPMGAVCGKAVTGSFTDPVKIRELAKLVDVVTVEIEQLEQENERFARTLIHLFASNDKTEVPTTGALPESSELEPQPTEAAA